MRDDPEGLRWLDVGRRLPRTARERDRSARLSPPPSPPTSGGGGAAGTRAPRIRRTRRAGDPDGPAFGSPFGPIGAGAGAILGFVYGILAVRDVEEKANEEAKRQEEIDAELERQIADQKANGATAEAGRPPQAASRVSPS